MTSTKRITDFRVSWTADHEQYYQGHSTMFTDYTHSGQGCGETLREAFEDALDDLAQQDIQTDGIYSDGYIPSMAILEELQSQVKEPEMLDMSIVDAECPVKGQHLEHADDCPPECDDADCVVENPDCAVCAGEWHYYVMVDVKVEEGQ